MATDLRSIWLMPAPDCEQLLSGIVRDLAARFGTPVFAPHLTLLGDVHAGADRLSDAVPAAVGSVPAFDEPVAAVETGDAFFRAFYARFAVSRPLGELKRRLDPAGLGSFLPHVSLLYGSGMHEKVAASAAELDRRLAGRPVRFDRVCMVRSGQEIPVADWSVLETTPLPGSR